MLFFSVFTLRRDKPTGRKYFVSDELILYLRTSSVLNIRLRIYETGICKKTSAKEKLPTSLIPGRKNVSSFRYYSRWMSYLLLHQEDYWFKLKWCFVKIRINEAYILLFYVYLDFQLSQTVVVIRAKRAIQAEGWSWSWKLKVET